jgi:hypothetical protein
MLFRLMLIILAQVITKLLLVSGGEQAIIARSKINQVAYFSMSQEDVHRIDILKKVSLILKLNKLLTLRYVLKGRNFHITILLEDDYQFLGIILALKIKYYVDL